MHHFSRGSLATHQQSLCRECSCRWPTTTVCATVAAATADGVSIASSMQRHTWHCAIASRPLQDAAVTCKWDNFALLVRCAERPSERPSSSSCRDRCQLAPVLSATAVLDGCSVYQWNQAPQPAIINPMITRCLNTTPLSSSPWIPVIALLYLNRSITSVHELWW